MIGIEKKINIFETALKIQMELFIEIYGYFKYSTVLKYKEKYTF